MKPFNDIVPQTGYNISIFHQRALDYARMFQWAVLPLHSIRNGRCTCGKTDCKNPGKHPRWDPVLIPNGLKNATTDENIINQWWTKWPDANIGIRTGAISGFIAIDIDPRHGGDITLDKLIIINGPFSDTVEAISGSGGRHILFKHPGGHVKTDDNVLGPGIDVKGDGGYIVACPSLHISGRHYEWELSSLPSETPLADLPEWLKAKIMQPDQGEPHHRKPSVYWMDIIQGVSEGRRNNAAASLTGYLLRHYINPYMVESIVEMWNEKNDPPLSWDELHRTINSVAGSELRRYKG